MARGYKSTTTNRNREPESTRTEPHGIRGIFNTKDILFFVVVTRCVSQQWSICRISGLMGTKRVTNRSNKKVGTHGALVSDYNAPINAVP